jgi:hypothetical protein
VFVHGLRRANSKVWMSSGVTSQAKGRVERAHHTLQDRLVKELRLAGISTIEAANAFLPSFVADYTDSDRSLRSSRTMTKA